jgi:hypothetical protein
VGPFAWSLSETTMQTKLRCWSLKTHPGRPLPSESPGLRSLRRAGARVPLAPEDVSELRRLKLASKFSQESFCTSTTVSRLRTTSEGNGR